MTKRRSTQPLVRLTVRSTARQAFGFMILHHPVERRLAEESLDSSGNRHGFRRSRGRKRILVIGAGIAVKINRRGFAGSKLCDRAFPGGQAEPWRGRIVKDGYRRGSATLQ